MVSKRFPRLVALVVVMASVLTLIPSAWAQMDQGRVVGYVHDDAGAAIVGATVVIHNQRTAEERTAKTNEEGLYIFTAMKPSFYTIKTSANQFQPVESADFQLSVGQELKRDIGLKVAGASTEIAVVDTAPAVDTSSARVGANVNQRELNELPINGRQLSQLYLQAPGTVNSGTGTFGDIRFSGRAVEQNAIRYDGIEGTGIIDASPGNLNGEIASPFRLQSSLENVQEFRVESNNYPAEYGTGTGGQVTVVTKSGSNQFHGSVFEYLRNDALDASNYFDRVQKSKLRQNQFGASLGGAIIKNKLFFFGAYEGYRVRSGLNSVEAVPSASACAGAVAAVQPICLAAFRGPGSVVLAGASKDSNFDILQLQSNSVVNENSGNVRFDYKINDKWSIFTRYFRDQANNDAPEGVTGRHTVIRSVPQNAVFTLSGILTPTVLNEFKVGYNGALTRVNGVAPTVNGIDLSAITLNITGSVANNGIAGQSSSSGTAVPGGLVRANSATNGRGAPYTPYSISFVDSLSWVRGSHSFKFGGETRMLRLYTDRLGGTTYTYSNLAAFLSNNATVQYVADLSSPTPFNGGATGERLAKEQFYIGYAQDEWRVRRDLTLTLGLRYEYYTPLREDRNLDVIFNIDNGTFKAPDTAFYQSSKTSFQPRVALAWSPGSGRTVFRGGFGIYNGPGQIEDQIQPIESDRITTSTSGTFPFNTATAASTFNTNFALKNANYQPRAYSNDYSVPERVYQYTAGVQHEFPYGMVVTGSYVGMQGRNLFLRSVANRITAVRTNTNPANAAVVIRQFSIDNGGNNVLNQFAEVDYKTSGGHDSYNALQTSLVRRFSRGLTLNATYTLGKSYGNTAGSNEASTAANNAVALSDFDYDNGYNNFDVRHTYNVSALYALPVGKGKRMGSNLNSIGEALLGNWEVGTIIGGRSGLPLQVQITRPDVVYRNNTNGTIVGSPCATCTALINTPGGGSTRNVRRPDLIPGVDPYLHNSGLSIINPAAFATPAPGTFGNLERNSIRGPSFNQVDMTLGKRFPLTESSALEFRTEVFNLFNKANFANPPVQLNNSLGATFQPGQAFNSTTAGTAFGVINRTVAQGVGIGTNRQIQFALRLTF